MEECEAQRMSPETQRQVERLIRIKQTICSCICGCSKNLRNGSYKCVNCQIGLCKESIEV